VVGTVTATTITVTTPPGTAGIANVTVVNPNGQSVVLVGAFIYM